MFDGLKAPSEAFTADEIALLQRTYKRIVTIASPAGGAGREDIAQQILSKFRQGARTEQKLLCAVQRERASRSAMRLVYDRLARQEAFPEK